MATGVSSRTERVLLGLTYGLGVALLGLCLWVMAARLLYPIDAEWMTGAMRDGVERVRDGKPLYAAPSARFIPFVYPPLYFWLSAMLARVCSSFVACKLVSLGATLAAGWGVYRISGSLGATRRWRRMAVLLFVATYPLTILFYDLERVDGLYAGMIVVAIAVLFSAKATWSNALAGALLGLAFFAKQAGVLAFAATVVGLLLAGERRRAAIVLGAGLAVMAIVFGWLESHTGGWFRYYCLKLPGAHGIRTQRLTTFFIEDAPKAFAITAASVALTVGVLVALLRDRKKPREEHAEQNFQVIVLAVVVGASMAAAFSFRAHAGGFSNVLVAWLPLGCPAFAHMATRAETWSLGTKAEAAMKTTLLAAVCLQLLGAMFDPMELAPNAEDMADRERLVALVGELERQGEVIVFPVGNISKDTHAHTAALYDVLRAGDHAPADLLAGLAERRYAALIVDVPVDCDFAQCDELETMIARNYFVAARRHERTHTGMTGYDARARWVLRPRKLPLPEASRNALVMRQRIEKSFAEMQTAQTPRDTEVRPSEAIEELAARALPPL